MSDFEQGDFEKADFEKKIQASLNANVDNLDANTRAQLATARRKAMNQPAKKSWLNSFNKNYWLPAGSLALCSLLAVFILVNPNPNNSHPNIANNQAQQQSTDQVAALELLNDAEDSDDNEMADPDFYLWADEMLTAESQLNAV